ncbi:MAG: tetratricopeptide repeat protein [Sedimentisphaerales bacterium]
MSRKSILFLTTLMSVFAINVALCPADDFQQISQARESIFLLLDGDRFSEAGVAYDKLINDFKNSPNLPWARYWISGRYQTFDRFEDAKQICEQIIRDYPDSPWAKKAKMGNAMTEAMSLIMSGKYAEAKEVIDKMAADFAGNPDLPEMLYWITERYERVSRFEDAKGGYSRILQNFPNSPMANKAKMGIARAGVMALILAKDFDKAREAIEQFTADFATSPDLPEALYWITERYVWVDRLDEAKPVCQRIVESYPRSSFADRAKLRVAIADVMALINSQDYDGAQSAFDNVVTDFKGHQDLPLAAIIIGEKYYRNRNIAESVRRAKKVFQIITEKLPVNSRSSEACCWAGDCCTELGQYAEAITYYRRCCDGFSRYGCSPGSRFDNGFRTRSLYMLGQSYQKLSDANNMPREEAEPLIIDSYERLVREFENCAVAKDGWRELGGIYAKNSRPQDTIRCYEAYLKLIPQERCPADVFYNLARAYDQTGNMDSAKKTYTKFLTSVLPTDPRRREVKSRLSAMGNTD